jgi:FAD/FMN-containing dehydrogenase
MLKIAAVARKKLNVTAIEFLDHSAFKYLELNGIYSPFERPALCYVLIDFDYLPSLAENFFEEVYMLGMAVDGVIAVSLDQANILWKIRESITDSLSKHTTYKNDISVLPSKITDFIIFTKELLNTSYPGFEIIYFGHLGDGNIHISILKPSDMTPDLFNKHCSEVTFELSSLLKKYGGSISAEHGIGLLKKPYMNNFKSDAEIEILNAIKKVFDPFNIMNPGKLL